MVTSGCVRASVSGRLQFPGGCYLMGSQLAASGHVALMLEDACSMVASGSRGQVLSGGSREKPQSRADAAKSLPEVRPA